MIFEIVDRYNIRVHAPTAAKVKKLTDGQHLAYLQYRCAAGEVYLGKHPDCATADAYATAMLRIEDLRCHTKPSNTSIYIRVSAN